MSQGQLSELEVGHSHPPQTVNRMSQILEDVPDQVVASLHDRDQDPRVLLVGRFLRVQLQDPGAPSVHHQPLLKDPRSGLFVQNTLDLGQVGLGDMIAGSQDSLGQIAVIGQKQEPFRVPVQTADRVYPFREATQEIPHTGASLRVLQGGDDTRRLVECVINQCLWPVVKGALTLTNLVATRLYGLGGVGDHLAIDPEAAIVDTLAQITAAAETTILQISLQGDGGGSFFAHGVLAP